MTTTPTQPAVPDLVGNVMDIAEARANRCLDVLDVAAYIWMGEADLPAMVANATSPMLLKRHAPDDVRNEFHRRMKEQLEAIVHMTFVEGAWRSQDLIRDTINAIRAERDSALSALTAAKAEVEKTEKLFSDPAALQVHLLRTGALSRMNALHIAGATDYDAIKAERDAALAELERVKKPVTDEEVEDLVVLLRADATFKASRDPRVEPGEFLQWQAADLLSRLSSRAEAAEVELREWLLAIAGGRRASIGSIDNTYCPQLSKERVDAALAALQPKPQRP